MATKFEFGIDWWRKGFICWDARPGDALNLLPTPLTYTKIDYRQSSVVTSASNIYLNTPYGFRAFAVQTGTGLNNGLAPIIVSATLGISNVILAESYVSFLGLGVQPPTASWGNMMNRALERMDTAWWLWFFPDILILLTVLSINFIGDGLRDALDPYSDK